MDKWWSGEEPRGVPRGVCLRQTLCSYRLGFLPPWFRHDLAEAGVFLPPLFSVLLRNTNPRPAFSFTGQTRSACECRRGVGKTSPAGFCCPLTPGGREGRLPQSRNNPNLRFVVFNPVTSPPHFTHRSPPPAFPVPPACTLLVDRSLPDDVWPPRRSATWVFPCVLTATPRGAAGASLNPWTVEVRILPLPLVSSVPWSDHL